MKVFYVKIKNSKVVLSGYCDDSHPELNTPDAIIIPFKFNKDQHYYTNGQILSYTEEEKLLKASQPNIYCRWDDNTMSWEDPRVLQDHKQAKRQEMKSARDERMLSGFTSNTIRYDSTVEAQLNIQTAVLQAMAAKVDSLPFNITWTAEDNSEVALNRTGVLDLGKDLQQMLNNAQDKYRTKKVAINAATTKEEVEAITW